jgi:cob(I)alamin adenosyltransferase
MKLTGRVVFRDIETGVWVLEGDDGRTYQLAGGDRKIKKDGQRVEVEGDVARDMLTAAMVGPVFNVASYRFL